MEVKEWRFTFKMEREAITCQLMSQFFRQLLWGLHACEPLCHWGPCATWRLEDSGRQNEDINEARHCAFQVMRDIFSSFCLPAVLLRKVPNTQEDDGGVITLTKRWQKPTTHQSNQSVVWQTDWSIVNGLVAEPTLLTEVPVEGENLFNIQIGNRQRE